MVKTQISITVFEVNGQEIVEVKSGADIVSDYSTLTSKKKNY